MSSPSTPSNPNDESATDSAGHPEPAGSVVRSAKRIAGITLASRVLGMVRDIALSAWLGNNWVQDRFTYGFAIPNVFRRLFGEGAMSAAFVPTLSESLSKEGAEEGKRLYAAVATLLAVVLAGVTLLAEVVFLVILLVGSDCASFQLSVGLTAAMFPFMPLICITALMASCLNVQGRFNWPAAMPIVMNIIQIACIWWVAPNLPGSKEQQIYTLAVSVVISGAAQMIILGTQLRRLGYAWRFLWLPKHPAVRKMIATMAPAMIGLGVLQIEPLIDGQIILWLSSAGGQQTVNVAGYDWPCPLAEGSMSSVEQAQRLYQFPLGVLAISLATAVFPALARYAAVKDHASMRGEVSRSVRLAIFEGLPAGVGLIVLAVPITRLLFERKAFGPEDTMRTAWILQFYAAGLWAFCTQHMLIRGFYAMHDTRTPMKVSLVTVAANVILNLILVWTPLGVGTFGLTAALTTSCSVVVLAMFLRRKLAGRLDMRAILRSVVKTAIATAVMGMVAGLVFHYGQHYWTSQIMPEQAHGAVAKSIQLFSRLLDVVTPMTCGIVAFLATAYALRSEELKELIGLRRR